MKDVIVPILIMGLGIAAAVLFCFGMTLEAAGCGIVALIITVAGLR